jgi:hypothetical protein
MLKSKNVKGKQQKQVSQERNKQNCSGKMKQQGNLYAAKEKGAVQSNSSGTIEPAFGSLGGSSTNIERDEGNAHAICCRVGFCKDDNQNLGKTSLRMQHFFNLCSETKTWCWVSQTCMSQVHKFCWHNIH